MKLSNNFSLEEFLKSSIADEHHLFEQYNPSNEVIENLEELCKNVLQPARETLGIPFTITSGYRCPKLNTIAKGATNSDHLYGFAADIICENNEELYKVLSQLPHTQCINEFGYKWIHISYNKNNLKNENFAIK